jgi:hypothetical protein
MPTIHERFYDMNPINYHLFYFTMGNLDSFSKPSVSLLPFEPWFGFLFSFPQSTAREKDFKIHVTNTRVFVGT